MFLVCFITVNMKLVQKVVTCTSNTTLSFFLLPNPSFLHQSSLIWAKLHILFHSNFIFKDSMPSDVIVKHCSFEGFASEDVECILMRSRYAQHYNHHLLQWSSSKCWPCVYAWSIDRTKMLAKSLTCASNYNFFVKLMRAPPKLVFVVSQAGTLAHKETIHDILTDVCLVDFPFTSVQVSKKSLRES